MELTVQQAFQNVVNALISDDYKCNARDRITINQSLDVINKFINPSTQQQSEDEK